MSSYGTIALLDDEIVRLGEIEFDVLALPDHIAVRANADRACALTKALIERGAIPDRRRRFLTDPDYHIGGRKLSRLALFQRSGNQGDEILRHPHFLPYLRYFIHGADLPKVAVETFSTAVDGCGDVTSGDIIPLGKLARQLIRSHALRPEKACEEFFKLAIDLGLSLMSATAIRNSARLAR